MTLSLLLGYTRLRDFLYEHDTALNEAVKHVSFRHHLCCNYCSVCTDEELVAKTEEFYGKD